jgi:hypothetical protein
MPLLSLSEGGQCAAAPRTMNAAPNPGNRQPATHEEPLTRIADQNNDQDYSERWADEPDNQQTCQPDKPEHTAWLYLLGIATILYLLALMFILLG